MFLKRLSNPRSRLVSVTILFLALAPTLGMIFTAGSVRDRVAFLTLDSVRDFVWLVLLMSAFALALAWFIWSERFLRQMNSLLETARQLASGDLGSRTGLEKQAGELGELARHIDAMAASLERQIREREQVERTLINRTHQQTVVAALGQFAMVSADFDELLNQTVNFITLTLEVEYCGVWEMTASDQHLVLRAGAGWKSGAVGHAAIESGGGTLVSHVFSSGEPVVFADLRSEKRFSSPAFFTEHGVVSGVDAMIPGGSWPFGVLGVHTTNPRKFTEDEIHFLIAIGTVIAMAVNRKQTEAQLHKLAGFAQLNPNPVMEFSADARLAYFNDAAMSMATLLGMESPKDFLPADTREIVRECLLTGKNRLRYETHPGNRILSWSFFPVAKNRVVHCYVGDITDRTNLEAQLRQSQKMESIGQLAAGVAHDFNNMLTIIQGHAGMIMARPDVPADQLDSTQAIYFAAERASSLTRQLLVFSRKNVLQTRTLDLKDVVANMIKMLTRLLGEIVFLQFEHPDELPSIRGDTGMIEQIIMNLAVNARDAMPTGGKLIIQLKAVKLDINYVEIQPQARPGEFVCLAITDTGSGMSLEIQNRIFEPFFTTKEVGKGTGLGLATVYGIVKQHEGWIEVESEVGKGTTFRIYFPPAPAHAERAPAAPASMTAAFQIRGGTETILVVEDEPVLRDLAQLILKELGYRVLNADSGKSALTVWEKEKNSIDLLLTDMVMPEGMSGRDLAEKLRTENPDLKVVVVSGYSVEDVTQEGITFLQKPYTRSSLAKVIRDKLDS